MFAVTAAIGARIGVTCDTIAVIFTATGTIPQAQNRNVRLNQDACRGAACCAPTCFQASYTRSAGCSCSMRRCKVG